MNIRYIISHGRFTGFKSIKSTYPYIIANMCLPLSLLFVVGILSEGTLLPYALAGGLISIIVASSIQSAGELTQFRLDNRHQDLIVATKTGPTDYMLGEMLGSLCWSIPAILLYIALDIFYNLLNPINLIMTIIICVLLTISALSLVLPIFSFVKRIRHAWAISTILSILMSTAVPTFYPYVYLPKSVLLVLSIIPSTPAAVLEQGLFNLAPMRWDMLGIMLIETIFYFLIAKYLTRWRDV